MNAQLIILAFLAITFLQSGYDKATDWNGNIGWLKGHFAQTPLKNQVPMALATILFLETLSGILAVVGMVQILQSSSTQMGHWACLLSAITLLFLLLGQRLAKDYDGARTIVIYLIPNLLGLYWM